MHVPFILVSSSLSIRLNQVILVLWYLLASKPLPVMEKCKMQSSLSVHMCRQGQGTLSSAQQHRYPHSLCVGTHLNKHTCESLCVCTPVSRECVLGRVCVHLCVFAGGCMCVCVCTPRSPCVCMFRRGCVCLHVHMCEPLYVCLGGYVCWGWTG